MKQIGQVDRFGLLSALLIHYMGGGKLDSIDLTRFPELVLRVYRKAITVVEERFDNDARKFYTVMLTRVFLAKIEDDFEMLAIEQWLDTELRAAGRHPREFN